MIVYWPKGILDLFCTWLEEIKKFRSWCFSHCFGPLQHVHVYSGSLCVYVWGRGLHCLSVGSKSGVDLVPVLFRVFRLYSPSTWTKFTPDSALMSAQIAVCDLWEWSIGVLLCIHVQILCQENFRIWISLFFKAYIPRAVNFWELLGMSNQSMKKKNILQFFLRLRPWNCVWVLT